VDEKERYRRRYWEGGQARWGENDVSAAKEGKLMVMGAHFSVLYGCGSCPLYWGISNTSSSEGGQQERDASKVGGNKSKMIEGLVSSDIQSWLHLRV